MRYLGLDIDRQWTFEPHFDSLIPKATAAANALCGLLPNIGGSDDLMESPQQPATQEDAQGNCHQNRQGIPNSVARVDDRSGRVFAVGAPGVEVHKKRYERRDPGGDSAEQAVPDDLGTAKMDAWDQWRSQLINETGEHRGAAAVLPNWETWRSRRGLPFTFRMIQVLTGHGIAYAGVLSGVGAAPLPCSTS
ncbi:uncharacterized protein LOC122571722 [Bombus pyrosoma]|uniref:uncharacterized protein LOC122571722 n=1 Tax=Bombus pyrosoma TaxID=396416 RepID=UPI001CB8BC73|nr:uncharacterized protein LOC122571722 [Bombus pyrosoma]